MAQLLQKEPLSDVEQLAQAVLREGMKAVAAELNPMDLKRGIDKAVVSAVAELKKLAKPCEDRKAISQVGTVSANADSSVGEIIADILADGLGVALVVEQVVDHLIGHAKLAPVSGHGLLRLRIAAGEHGTAAGGRFEQRRGLAADDGEVALFIDLVIVPTE